MDATNTDMLDANFLRRLRRAGIKMTATSMVKLMRLGNDRHQQGMLLDLRPPDPTPRAVPQIPMSTQDRQGLAMLDDLRTANELDLTPFLDDPHLLRKLLSTPTTSSPSHPTTTSPSTRGGAVTPGFASGFVDALPFL